jgi:hypothetical protein
MWWIVFTAVELYIGLVVLDALMPSLSAEKRQRARVAKKVVVVLLVVLAIALAAVLIRRWNIQA